MHTWNMTFGNGGAGGAVARQNRVGESRLLYKPGHDKHQGFGEPLLIMNIFLLVHLSERRKEKSALDGGTKIKRGHTRLSTVYMSPFAGRGYEAKAN